MQRLRDRLSVQGADLATMQATEAALAETNPIGANPMFLASYGREH
jgi:hypothetical protein